jgi:hypothetical protein
MKLPNIFHTFFPVAIFVFIILLDGNVQFSPLFHYCNRNDKRHLYDKLIWICQKYITYFQTNFTANISTTRIMFHFKLAYEIYTSSSRNRSSSHTQLIVKNCYGRCQNVLCWPTSCYCINGNALNTGQRNICPGRLYMTVILNLKCSCFEFDKNILKSLFYISSFMFTQRIL